MLMALSSSLMAQNGTLRGKVVSGSTGEPLLGATLRVLQGTQMRGGAYTDLEGSFNASIAPGTYTLIVSYISFLDDTLTGVTVEPGQVVYNEFTLLEEQSTREDLAVEITATRSQASQVALFNIKRTSVNTMDGVTLDQIRRTGDANVAAAMTRVVGVTVEGGKYVYVRGLGDRYSKTLLNGAELPSLDPNRNSVQMDIFPSNLVDNILVFKNFTPNLPGSFSGGLVDVRTKDFPNSFTLRANASLGFNTQASLNDRFLAEPMVGMEALGFADDSRQIPAYIADLPNGIPSRPVTLPQLEARGPVLEAAAKSFETRMASQRRPSGINQNYELSIGNQHLLAGRPFGYIASLTYRRTQSFFENGIRNQYNLPGTTSEILDPQVRLRGDRGEDEVTWGGLVKLSYKPHPNHKVSANYMRNQNGSSYSEFFQGRFIASGGDLNLQTRTSGFIERGLTVLQLQGDHVFGPLKADWIASRSTAQQDEPDLRFFANEFQLENGGEDTTFIIDDAAYDRPLRFYRSLSETNLDLKLNLQVEVPGLASEEKGAVRFGGAYTTKDRSFNETRYEIFPGRNAAGYNGSIDDYFSPDNFGYTLFYNPDNGRFTGYEERLFYQDVTLRQNVFDATQAILAAYAMVEMPLGPKLKFIGGARYETTDMEILPNDSTLFDPIREADSTATPGLLSLTDILPSASFIFKVNDRMNIRANYARTLARPSIMEFSQFERLPYIGGPIYEGNPLLERTLIDNVDLRWEWFFSITEMVSVSAFYKNFQNPIEVAQDFSTQNLRFTYVNRESAYITGLEFEVKKNLAFIAPSLEKLQIGANASLIYSETPLTEEEIRNIQAVDPTRPETRPLFGQSPYVVNTELAYVDRDDLGLQAALNFNVFGPRLFAVGGAAPDIYEQPRPSLNFTLSKTLGEHWSIRFRANNLLNPEYNFTQTFREEVYFFQSNRIGRTFSLSATYQI